MKRALRRLKPFLSLPWNPLSPWVSGILALVLIKVVYVYAVSSTGFVPIVDHANRVFHYLGQRGMGVLGETIGLYGGVLTPLLYPVAIAAVFWIQRDAVGWTAGLCWLAENFLYIGRCMSDARAQRLGLPGNEQDWLLIFARWNVLPYDTWFGSIVSALGWLGLAVSAGWLAWRWFLRLHPSDPDPQIPQA